MNNLASTPQIEGVSKGLELDKNGQKQPSFLRKWDVLESLSNEELEKVARVEISKLRGELSALLLSTDNKVYYVGRGNSEKFPFIKTSGNETPIGKLGTPELPSLSIRELIWGYPQNHEKSPISKIPGSENKTTKHESPVFSDLNIKELVFRDSFIVALTKDDELFLWGTFYKPEGLPASAFVSYELYNAAKPSTCKKCGYKYTSYSTYGFTLCYCSSKCGKYSTRPYDDTFDSTRFVKCIKYAEAIVACDKCSQLCTSLALGEWNVNYCQRCSHAPQDVEPIEEVIEKPQKIKLPEAVVRVSCGSTFFVALTITSQLILWGKIGWDVYRSPLYNPDQVVVKDVSCGGEHVTVVTSLGELYTCGQGGLGQLGYPWDEDMGHLTLRKVPLEGYVVKVCCGLTSTVCLMGNGSIMCWGSNMKLLSPNLLVVNQPKSDYVSQPAKLGTSAKFVNLVNAPLTNVFSAQSDSGMVLSWGRCDRTRQPKLVFCDAIEESIANLPASFSFKYSCPPLDFPKPDPISPDLYGKTFLSDLTLHLSDGDFPVHRLVLFPKSVYFKTLFETTESSNTLDMTLYNPKAYRCLLQYFYNVPPTNLDCPDLFDLYILASCYKEAAIAKDVFEKLRANVSTETVLQLCRKAEDIKCTEVLKMCDAFMNSPEFKNIVANSVSQDMKKAMFVLEFLQKDTD